MKTDPNWYFKEDDMGMVVGLLVTLAHIIAVLCFWQYFNLLKLIACHMATFTVVALATLVITAGIKHLRSCAACHIGGRSGANVKYVRLETAEPDVDPKK
jgi:hypothetical protein